MRALLLTSRILSALSAGSVASSLLSGCGGKLEHTDSLGGAGGVPELGGASAGSGGRSTSKVEPTSAGSAGLSGTSPDAGSVAIDRCMMLEERCYPRSSLVDAGAHTAGEGGEGGEAVTAAIACPADRGALGLSFCDGVMGEPELRGEDCCFRVHLNSCCVGGRPFIVAGAPRVAPPRERSDWMTDDLAPDSDGDLTAALREQLARAWLGDAQAEHASIASFARLTLQLLELGAPAHLVEASQRAALDEVAHARSCFALASRYASRDIGPGPLVTSEALSTCTLSELAVATVHEGCVGETIAAFVAGERLAVARDPQVRQSLERIAEDEARHAELAFRIVAWALAAGGPGVRSAVASAFAGALTSRPPPAQPSEQAPVPANAHLGAHGCLDSEGQARSGAEALHEIIRPCAEALLADTARNPASSEHLPEPRSFAETPPVRPA